MGVKQTFSCGVCGATYDKLENAEWCYNKCVKRNEEILAKRQHQHQCQHSYKYKLEGSDDNWGLNLRATCSECDNRECFELEKIQDNQEVLKYLADKIEEAE